MHIKFFLGTWMYIMDVIQSFSMIPASERFDISVIEI